MWGDVQFFLFELGQKFLVPPSPLPPCFPYLPLHLCLCPCGSPSLSPPPTSAAPPTPASAPHLCFLPCPRQVSTVAGGVVGNGPMVCDSGGKWVMRSDHGQRRSSATNKNHCLTKATARSQRRTKRNDPNEIGTSALQHDFFMVNSDDGQNSTTPGPGGPF